MEAHEAAEAFLALRYLVALSVVHEMAEAIRALPQSLLVVHGERLGYFATW